MEQQQAELKTLSEMPNESIDYSDIPLLAEAFWKDAVRKTSINIQFILSKNLFRPLCIH